MTADDLAAKVQLLVDRQAIEDELYRYASAIDRKDYDTLRTVLADDAVGIYGERAPVEGADAMVSWISQHSADKAWQHHLLNVYHVDIDGDAAQAVTYHTSHQTTEDRPDKVVVIIARYHDTLRREADGRWRITRKVMEVGWRETR